MLKRLRVPAIAFVAAIFLSIVSYSIVSLAGFANVKVQKPPHFSSMKDAKARKKAFFNYLKPIITEINRARMEERQQLKTIYSALRVGKTITKEERHQLELWGQRYDIEIKPDNLKTTAETLLIHLDQIPESMVLAQAAIESAWGTSRFVTTGNNYFGQWCYRKGCGMVPRARQKGAKHEVRRFDNAKQSVSSYFQNINSHPAYKKLRKIRAQARESGKSLSGMKLVAGLKNYSQRGQNYVDELRQIIRFNKIE